MRFNDLRNPVLLVASGFGAGLVPRAPGTAGTLVAAALWLALFAPLPWWAQGVVCTVAAVFGVWLCDRAVAALGVDDPPGIVWDEFAGGAWIAVALAVVLFRVLDILKPGPVGAAERCWAGGLGVMADDLVAGALAGVIAAIGAGLIL